MDSNTLVNRAKAKLCADDLQTAFEEWARKWGEADKAKKPRCSHDWEEYFGLTEHYDFCTLCDEKRPHEQKANS